MMIENVIRINRAEFDRLALLTEKKGYLAASFNIATQDKFPLHKIHYVFERHTRLTPSLKHTSAIMFSNAPSFTVTGA